MASPHVAGAFALLYAMDSTMSPSKIDSMLQSNKLTIDLGVSGRDDIYGYGKLDLPKALDNLFIDNNDNSYTYAYTDKNYLDFGASTTKLNIDLIKSGTGSLSVTSLGADNASGLSYSGSDFSTYTIILMNFPSNGEFSNTIYFNLSNKLPLSQYQSITLLVQPETGLI